VHDALLASLSGDRSVRTSADEGRVPVWLFVGVNGVGKTTSIGKLAQRLVDEGRSVVLAAGDTFRAAASEQLQQWATRTGADIVRANEGADPGSVVHDALGRAAARGADIVLADTAGRRANSTNLLDELSKIRRVADRDPGQVVETFMVLDATTGQNALSQAREFLSAAAVTGIVLTKLDGTARGGIVVAIERELGIPVKYVGVGEGVADLIVFEPRSFVDSLLEA
jgi:fused signal recognition particle receptor